MINLGDHMKKIVFLFLVIVLFSFFVIESKEKQQSISLKEDTIKKESSKKINKTDEMRALFISYMELNTYIQDKTKEESQTNIQKIISTTKNNHFNTLILQVRSYDDAIYKTDLFPISKSIILKDGSSYDVLDYFLKTAKKEQIDIYLWINPFRITRPNEALIENTYAYKYKDTSVVQQINNIYYYNPAREETTTHIVDGIKELVKNYQFKGLLFDDYFYPNGDIDTLEYTAYNKEKSITKQDYHLQVINKLIKKIYKEIKKINSNVLFGISPDGNIENNYQKNYADVKTWCSKEGYIDFIMPQLYYGFYNTNKPFIETMNEWNNLVTNKQEKVYYALAFYKAGKEDVYARNGKNEWIENSDMIRKQIIIARNTTKYSGFSLFRYDSLFNRKNYTDTTEKELANLAKVLKVK